MVTLNLFIKGKLLLLKPFKFQEVFSSFPRTDPEDNHMAVDLPVTPNLRTHTLDPGDENV